MPTVRTIAEHVRGRVDFVYEIRTDSPDADLDGAGAFAPLRDSPETLQGRPRTAPAEAKSALTAWYVASGITLPIGAPLVKGVTPNDSPAAAKHAPDMESDAVRKLETISGDDGIIPSPRVFAAKLLLRTYAGFRLSGAHQIKGFGSTSERVCGTLIVSNAGKRHWLPAPRTPQSMESAD